MITEVPEPAIFSKRWDICVIGSGAIGIAMALSLSRSGKSVIVVEAGSEEISDQAQSFYTCESVGHPHEGCSKGRFRVFGGSTERWGGQAMRFEPEDFERRDGIHPDGWPVSADELSRFYDQAEEYMGVPAPDYSGFRDVFKSAASKFKIDAATLEDAIRPFQLHYSVFTAQPRLREKYREELSTARNLLVLLKSPAQQLHTDALGNITELGVRTADGSLRSVHAGDYVLACGCIENARFLLIQRDRFHLEALKQLPMLGRCMQDHPGAHLGEIKFTRGGFLQDLFRLKNRSGIAYKARISWSGEQRKSDQLLAVSGTLLMMRARSEFHPEDSGGPGISPTDWWNVIPLLAKGYVFSPIHHTYLAVSAEDLRDPESSISLSPTAVDTYRNPLAVIDWRVSTRVADSIIHYTEKFERLLRTCDLGTLRRFPFVNDSCSLRNHLRDNSHHIGATSMGSDRSTGVVDKQLKVFGINNLYVGGTSVLPTGSHANPTLTALALSLRLADHLACG